MIAHVLKLSLVAFGINNIFIRGGVIVEHICQKKKK